MTQRNWNLGKAPKPNVKRASAPAAAPKASPPPPPEALAPPPPPPKEERGEQEDVRDIMLFTPEDEEGKERGKAPSFDPKRPGALGQFWATLSKQQQVALVLLLFAPVILVPACLSARRVLAPGIRLSRPDEAKRVMGAVAELVTQTSAEMNIEGVPESLEEVFDPRHGLLPEDASPKDLSRQHPDIRLEYLPGAGGRFALWELGPNGRTRILASGLARVLYEGSDDMGEIMGMLDEDDTLGIYQRQGSFSEELLLNGP